MSFQHKQESILLLNFSSFHPLKHKRLNDKSGTFSFYHSFLILMMIGFKGFSELSVKVL